MGAIGKGYGQYCPVAKGAEIFAERWTPLVLRELLSGSRRFNDIRRGLPRMSQSLLSRRLKELEWAGIVKRQAAANGAGWEYHLTPSGEELRPVVKQLGIWAYRWLEKEVTEDDLHAGVLMLDISRTLASRPMPPERVVVKIVLPDAAPGFVRWWLMLEAPAPDLCDASPGFPEDITLTCGLRTLTRIWLGDLTYDQARRKGELELEGRPAMVRRLPELIGASDFTREKRRGG